MGSGLAEVAPENNTVTYTIGNEGFAQIIYTLESPDQTDTKIGTIDIAVSNPLNHAPTTTPFVCPNTLAIDEQVTIDVALYIADADGDPLQLVEVSSMSAAVASLDPQDLTNTQFTFSAATGGTHYVSYLIHDQQGGYATGQLQVKVLGDALPVDWGNISVNDLTYTAPLTAANAIAQSVNIDGGWTDYNYMPR